MNDKAVPFTDPSKIIHRSKVIRVLSKYSTDEFIVGRPDLFDDIVDFVSETTFGFKPEFSTEDETRLFLIYAYRFLLANSMDTISTADLEFMARLNRDKEENNEQ